MTRKLVWIAFAALVLLSISSGLTKLVRLPAEMELFALAGFSELMTLAFGLVQLAGGLLLLPTASRRYGAMVMIATFSVASWVVWVSGMTGFFLVSLVFIFLATLPLWRSELNGRKA